MMAGLGDVAIFAGMAIQIAALVVILHKVRRIHLKTYKIESDVRSYAQENRRQQQIDRLLHYELDLKHPLPPMGGWAGSPDFLNLLARHHQATRPQRIVECGSGVSTLVLARCCQREGIGHVVTLEHHAAFAEQSRQELIRYGLSDWATVIHAPLEPVQIDGATWTWYRTSNLPAGDFEMMVIDGPPADTGKLARYPAGPLLLSRLAPGGTAFLDDSDRPDEQEIVQRWRAEQPNFVVTSHFAEKGCISLSLPPLARS